MYKVNLVPSKETQLTLRDIKHGELAVVTDGDFKGELFFKNVIGLHGITQDRYWPSSYAKKHGADFGPYEGPLDQPCRRIVPGDVLQIL